MPDDDLPNFLRRLKTVAERIREHAQFGIASTNPTGELKLIAEDAGYLLGEIDDQQSPVADRWKCQACGKVATTRKPVRRRALLACRCGQARFEPAPHSPLI